MLKFGNCFVGLGNVHVHFVTVEISVVGCTHRQVQTESVVGQNSDSVAHHTHSVESWLSVEKHIVPVL